MTPDQERLSKQLSQTIHYLSVLQDNYSIMQKELRDAVDHALKILVNEKRIEVLNSLEDVEK